MELLAHTARLWRSLGHHDAQGRFHIDGVTGPDEYSAIADNNVYTNLMAQQNLRAAADAAKRYPDRARELGVDAEEAASWRDAAEAMYIPYDEMLGVHPQSDRFTRHQVWDFEHTSADQYPLLLHFPYFDLYRKQVVKQADLVLAMQLRPDAFTAEQKARNFDYYEPLTVRDSSLSACTQAVMAAEVGHLDLAFDYLGEAALMDLRDLEHNTRDGVHIASLAGTWIALVDGFGGLRHANGEVSLRAAAAGRAHPAGVHPLHPGSAAAGRGNAPQRQVHAGRRRIDRDRPPRREGASHLEEAADVPDRGDPGPAAAQAAAGARARPPPTHHGQQLTGPSLPAWAAGRCWPPPAAEPRRPGRRRRGDADGRSGAAG